MWNKVRDFFNSKTTTSDSFLLGLWTSAFFYESIVEGHIFGTILSFGMWYLHFKSLKDEA